MGKILSIKERVPQETTLPDGTYTGTWSGYCIEITFNKKTYELTTEEGVRGIGIRVVVNVVNGIAKYSTVNN